MKDFKIVEGTAEDIEAYACEEDMNSYDLESLRFTHRSYFWEGEGQVSKDQVSKYVAVFRLHKGS